MKVCFLICQLTWCGCCANKKKGDGFQGWHQDFSLGSCITKTIVVNVGSKETQNQDTPVSFDDGFEAEEWEEAASYAISVFQNSEDELHVEPVAIHVKNASVEAAFNELKPPATTEQDKMFEHEEQPTVYPTNNPSVTAHDDNIHASSTLLEETVQTFQDPPVIHPSLEDNLPVTRINNPSILAQDDSKSAATRLEETLLTMQQPPVMHPSLPPFGSSVDYWICENCDCYWPPSQTRCGTCKRWKGGKRTIRTSTKSKPKEKTESKEMGKKRGRKSKSLTPIPGQDVDIPLVVGGALVVGDTTFSPLTGGLNANKSSTGPSIGMNSYDDATIGENTIDQETNDEMI